MQKLRGKLTFANVVACLALFIALGGASYAATSLPKNSVGTKQLKKGAVTAAKVKAGSLTASSFAPGQVPSGPRGATGATGPQGPAGTSGAGPLFVSTDLGDATINTNPATEIGSIALPAGSYLVMGKVSSTNKDESVTSSILSCQLTSNGAVVDVSQVRLVKPATNPPLNIASLPLQAAVSLPAGGTVGIGCASLSGTSLEIENPKLSAIQVTDIR